MARRIVKKGSAEFNLFGAIFQFWKDHGTPEDSHEYFDGLIHSISHEIAFNDAFKECKDLSTELSLAVLNVIEARYKSMKEYGDYKHGFEMIDKYRKEIKEGNVKKISGV